MLLTIKTDFSKSRFYNRNFRKICRTMTQVTHQSAKETHYDKGAEKYDTFNEENSKTINATIETILGKYGVKTVLDLTCGTGS